MISLFFDFAKLLDVHSIVAADVSSNTFHLCNSGIDFLPAEVMKNDKTAGKLGSDYNKIDKVWCWVWKNDNSFTCKRFNTALLDTTKYTSKMRSAYLKLRNLPILEKIDDKRNVVLEEKNI